MKRMLVALAVVLSALGLSAVQSQHAGAASPRLHVEKQKKCHPYRGKCHFVPSGTFTVQVTNSDVKLQGTGTPKTAGTAYAVARVSVLHLSKHEEAFRVFASGPLPPLRLTRKGTLYELDVAHNVWHQIRAVTAPGIYKVVFG